MEKDIKKSYIWYHDKKIIGMVMFFIVVSFQIFAFLKIPFLSSIHGYTIGMMLGFYNPFFYLFIGYMGINIVFGGKLNLPKWFKLNVFNYWIVVISIVFISVSSSFYQNETGYTSMGSKPWKSFNKWYSDFISNDNAWFPANTNGGIIGAFMYSFFAMMLSGIGALIVSIIMVFIVISYIISGTSIGFYKQLKDAKNKSIKEIIFTKKNHKEDKQAEIHNHSNEEKPIEKSSNVKLEKREGNENILPFDDPF